MFPQKANVMMRHADGRLETLCTGVFKDGVCVSAFVMSITVLQWTPKAMEESRSELLPKVNLWSHQTITKSHEADLLQESIIVSWKEVMANLFVYWSLSLVPAWKCPDCGFQENALPPDWTWIQTFLSHALNQHKSQTWPQLSCTKWSSCWKTSTKGLIVKQFDEISNSTRALLLRCSSSKDIGCFTFFFFSFALALQD